jgi:hypothetical protein
VSGNGSADIRVYTPALFLAIWRVAYNHIHRGGRYRGMFYVAKQHLHFVFKSIQVGIPAGLKSHFCLDFKADGLLDGPCQEQKQEDDSASGSQIKHDLFFFDGDKFSKQRCVNRKSVTVF